MTCICVFDKDLEKVVDFYWTDDPAPIRWDFQKRYPNADRYEIFLEGERSLPLTE